MLKTLRNLVLAFLLLAVALLGLHEWWRLDLRWRPVEIKRDQAEIGKVIEASGWVSPGLTGPKLYVVAYRASPESRRFMDTDFPILQKAGVDTRVIMIARDDQNGAAMSTANERSTVAELWVNRNWGLFQKWMAAPLDNWPATGIPAADSDVARSAVVEAGRASVDKLTPLLKDNGLAFAYPTLIWWSRDGKMKACVCTDARNDKYVLKDLAAGG